MLNYATMLKQLAELTQVGGMIEAGQALGPRRKRS
jgi:hypothetical protein